MFQLILLCRPKYHLQAYSNFKQKHSFWPFPKETAFQAQIGVNKLIIISMQQQSKKKYLSIIAAMEKAYSQGRTSQELHQIFKACLAKEFKMDLTSDSAMEEVMKEYFRKCQQNFVGSQTYCKKLSFIEKLNNLLYGIGFISRREHLRLKDALSKERDSPANQWLENMAYLRSSESREEFRYEFLTRYCSWTDAAANELLEDEDSKKVAEQMRNAYYNFFRGCLEQDLPDMKAVSFIEDSFSHFERKAEMLPPELIRDLDKRLGREVGGTEEELSLNKALMELAQENAYANDEVAKQRLEDEVKLIEKALQKFSGLNIIKSKGLQVRLGKFGSLTSGFAGVDADLDLTILTNCYVNQVEFLKLLCQFLKKEYRQEDRNGPRKVYVDLINAKTPLVQLKVVERGRVDLKIDIIVNNLLGVINSRFLQVYSQVRWIRTLGLLVKMWGKAKMVIDKNMLSSYAIVLMLIHYLIKTKRAKAILDHRITAGKAYFDFKRMKQADVEKFKVYYQFKEDPKEVSVEERANYYALLCGFMKYYAQDFWREDERNRIVTVDQSIDRPVDAECALTIKDPFDEPHNPGRIKLDSKEYLISKFKEAYQLLRSGKQEKVRGLFV